MPLRRGAMAGELLAGISGVKRAGQVSQTATS